VQASLGDRNVQFTKIVLGLGWSLKIFAAACPGQNSILSVTLIHADDSRIIRCTCARL
jgi:hypothetical protein